jgi:hypothetical protein
MSNEEFIKLKFKQFLYENNLFFEIIYSSKSNCIEIYVKSHTDDTLCVELKDIWIEVKDE